MKYLSNLAVCFHVTVDFSFPRLAKKYKGDVVPSFLVPRNIQQLKKNTSVFTALDLANHVEDLEALLEEAEDDLTYVTFPRNDDE